MPVKPCMFASDSAKKAAFSGHSITAGMSQKQPPAENGSTMSDCAASHAIVCARSTEKS